jgi:hypothetical protein
MMSHVPSVSEWILNLIYLSSEQDHIVNDESQSCLDVILHADSDSREDVENTNDLVGQRMFGSLFTMEDIDQREHIILEEVYVSSHHSIPPIFPSDEKETSCVVKLTSYFSIVDTEEGFPVDNETLQLTPMVMLDSHFSILYLTSE